MFKNGCGGSQVDLLLNSIVLIPFENRIFYLNNDVQLVLSIVFFYHFKKFLINRYLY